MWPKSYQKINDQPSLCCWGKEIQSQQSEEFPLLYTAISIEVGSVKNDAWCMIHISWATVHHGIGLVNQESRQQTLSTDATMLCQ